MIQLYSLGPDKWEIIQKATLANIERERQIGLAMAVPSIDKFVSSLPGKQGAVAVTDTLPAAINALIELHKLTDYQYAPWPSMEEDEE